MPALPGINLAPPTLTERVAALLFELLGGLLECRAQAGGNVKGSLAGTHAEMADGKEAECKESELSATLSSIETALPVDEPERVVALRERLVLD